MSPDPTVRVVYDPDVAMAGRLCLREVRPHHLCTRPWRHDSTCLALPAIPAVDITDGNPRYEKPGSAS